VEAHLAHSGTVIDPGEDGEALAAHDFVEAANGFLDGIRAGDRSVGSRDCRLHAHDRSCCQSQNNEVPRSHCSTCTGAPMLPGVPATMTRYLRGVGPSVSTS